ncbi:hypothetical protein D9M72_466860 [compost metagenome]
MSGTPRSDAALRWSPARIPRPPEYCGKTSVIPNSGEKYAMQEGASSPRLWYQRGCSRYRSRSSAAACTRRTTSWSAASRCSSSRLTRPRKLTGSCALSSQIAGFRPSKSSRVGRCHDHRRLVANRASGRIDSGRTVRTVNLRIAFTCVTLTDKVGRRNRFRFLLGK